METKLRKNCKSTQIKKDIVFRTMFSWWVTSTETRQTASVAENVGVPSGALGGCAIERRVP